MKPLRTDKIDVADVLARGANAAEDVRAVLGGDWRDDGDVTDDDLDPEYIELRDQFDEEDDPADDHEYVDEGDGWVSVKTLAESDEYEAEDDSDLVDEEDYEEPDPEIKAMFDSIPKYELWLEEKKVGGSMHPAALRLKKYWTVGEGGAKIRWGQPGDGKRCIRQLRKYLGVRAPGYCQNLHQLMVGGRVMGQGPGEVRGKKSEEGPEQLELIPLETIRELLGDGYLFEGEDDGEVHADR